MQLPQTNEELRTVLQQMQDKGASKDEMQKVLDASKGQIKQNFEKSTVGMVATKFLKPALETVKASTPEAIGTFGHLAINDDRRRHCR